MTKLLAGEDCGFMATADDCEIYFHRSTVLDHGFDRPAAGAEERFVEESGEKCAQASMVRLVGKRRRG